MSWGPDPQFSAGWARKAAQDDQAEVEAEVEAEEEHATEDATAARARARAGAPRRPTGLGRIRKLLRRGR